MVGTGSLISSSSGLVPGVHNHSHTPEYYNRYRDSSEVYRVGNEEGGGGNGCLEAGAYSGGRGSNRGTCSSKAFW